MTANYVAFFRVWVVVLEVLLILLLVQMTHEIVKRKPLPNEKKVTMHDWHVASQAVEAQLIKI